MKKILYLIIIFSLFFNKTHYSQKISVCLFYLDSIKTIVITPTLTPYKVFSNNEFILKLHTNNILNITENNGFLNIRNNGENYGDFKNIEIVSSAIGAKFRIKPVFPSLESRNYLGDLQIMSVNQKLQIVNNIDIEEYVPGVVETEGGSKAELEYYKSQAIICRTYVMGHMRRHEEEGFNLCDGVHCQAYKSLCSLNLEIVAATNSTKNLIITDENLMPITAVYHSNCGGATVNSENVWSYPKNYLKAVEDTFCLNGNHARWSDSLLLSDWIDYLVENNFNIQINNNPKNLEFVQTKRELFYIIKEDSISLKKIRHDFGFKSTFFNIRLENEKIYFDGKGYGHGVGLCQEGAMKMAEYGKNYFEIIKKYYRNIKIQKIEN